MIIDVYKEKFEKDGKESADKYLLETLNNMACDIYSSIGLMKELFSAMAYSKGFHTVSNGFCHDCMLIVTEIAEAVEGDRKDRMDDHLPNLSNRSVELADAIIRIMDMCGKHNIDIAQAVVDKALYNMGRQHLHGKVY